MRSLAFFLALALPATAQAHEIWVERDRAGPVRIYLGEPEEVMPAGGDPEFAKLLAPKIVGVANVPTVRKAGFIEAQVPGKGDVRVIDDSVFAPWGDGPVKEGVIYYARAGRSETKSAMPYEIAPLTKNGNRFALLRRGKAVPRANMTLIAPDKTSTKLTADAAGVVTVATPQPGRYLLGASHEETGDLRVAAGPVGKLYHMATTTFVAK
jgi:hypothetical protein